MSMANLRFLPFAQTALKNLFSKPATTAYPFAPAQYPQRMRGHVEIKIEDCIGCGLCARSCPPGALSVDRKAGTWTIQRFDCVQCGSCVNVCPKKCLTMAQGYTQPDTQKKSETFTRPAAPETAQAGGKPVNDASKCILYPLREKVPAAGHCCGPGGENMDSKCGELCGLWRLCGRLPQEMPGDEGVNLCC